MGKRIQNFRRTLLPVTTVLLAALLAWYGAAWYWNAPGAIERVLDADAGYTWQALLHATLTMDRPLIPAPHQVAQELMESLGQWPVSSPRNVLYHVKVTGECALLGFAMGTALGLLLAIGIVHSRTLDRALMPWIVASQSIPVLAIAPIVLVILGNLGLSGVMPKAVIAMNLSFFPIVSAMVVGLRSPDVIAREMFYTYAASRWQTLWMLRLPAALPFLFPSLRVAAAASLVGAMVAELPTGAQAGLGARLLTGSYYGQTTQIWSTLLMSSLLGLLMTGAVSALERGALGKRKAA
jgi:NitT/TauT family transport system permease protein